MIKIEINDTEVQAAFKQLIDAGTDLEPVFRDIGEYIQKSTKDRFAAGEGPDGEKWEYNTDYTLARKKGDKPLIGESKRLSTEISYDLINDGVEIGSPLEYAAVQQFGADKHSFSGGKSPWGDIPARPFLGVSDTDRINIVDILTEHLRT